VASGSRRSSRMAAPLVRRTAPDEERRTGSSIRWAGGGFEEFGYYCGYLVVCQHADMHAAMEISLASSASVSATRVAETGSARWTRWLTEPLVRNAGTHNIPGRNRLNIGVTPAPDEGSKPAMVSTTGGTRGGFGGMILRT